ncbi:MAG: dihydroorotase, partial [Muribaculaceae bacterium]|nr:dihydroorotase [Muribaculaceae bacterium]
DLVDIDRGVHYTVRQENILSKCGWSPFEGYTFHNTIHRTYVNGVMVYDQGTVNPSPAGERLIFNN